MFTMRRCRAARIRFRWFVLAAAVAGAGVLAAVGPHGGSSQAGAEYAASVRVVSAGPQWCRWRGPEGVGHVGLPGVPRLWSAADVVWKTPLPGRGQSSPVLWGERIFLTAALDQGRQRVVLCLDARSGEVLWQQTAWTGEPEPSHKMNGWASATCAVDGEVVIAFFGRGGLHAYTLDGQRLWSRDLGPFTSPWGTAACPIIVGDLVIQNCDADENAHIAAFDRRSGETVWDTPRPDHRGWSTPLLIETAGRRELVLNGHEGVQAYDPATGEPLWFCSSSRGRGEPSVVLAGELIYVVNGLAGDMYAVRPGGSGDVSDSHRVWSMPRKGGRDQPSPIVVDRFLLVMNMQGILDCYDCSSGELLWKERVGGTFTASPIAAGGLVYFLRESGETFVVRPGPQYELVAENSVGGADDEIFRASPTPNHGALLIRSDQVLYCVGQRAQETSPGN